MALTTTIVDQSSRSTANTTLSSVPIGTAAGDRVVFVYIVTNSGNDPSSVTIGGVSGTFTSDGSGFSGEGWISAAVPTGTTATIVLGGATSGFLTQGVWNTTGDATAAVAQVQYSNDATSPDSTAAFAVTAGDSLIAVSTWGGTGTPTMNFTAGVVSGGTRFTDSFGQFNIIGKTDYATSPSQVVTATYSITPDFNAIPAARLHGTGGGGSNKTISADGGTYTITGAAVTLKRGRVVAANGGSYAISGSAVTLRKNKPVTILGGSYAVTGAAVTLREARKVSADGGSYSITGANVTVSHGYSVVASGGSYAVSGASVTLRHAYLVSVGAGSYSINGAAVTLTKLSSKTVAADAGSYAITGAAVSLLHKWKVSAAASSYAVTGAAVTLRHAYKLSASGGSYSITGASVTLTLTSGAAVAVGAGTYAVTGASVPLLQTRYVSAESGQYLIIGSDVSIDFGVAPGTWVPVTQQAETWTPKTDPSSSWTEVTKSQETWTRIN